MLSTGILAWYWLEVHLCVKDICPESSGICSLETPESETESFVSFVFHEVSQMSALIYFHVAFPFDQALAEALKTNTSVTSIDLSWQFHRQWGSEGLLCPGIPSGCSWCLCRQFGERLCSLAHVHPSHFQVFKFSWLWVKWVNCFLTWTYSVLYDVVCFLLGYWHCKPHLPWIQWELLFGNSESETESCVSFVFHEVSQMSALIYFHVAFPFARH